MHSTLQLYTQRLNWRWAPIRLGVEHSSKVKGSRERVDYALTDLLGCDGGLPRRGGGGGGGGDLFSLSLGSREV